MHLYPHAENFVYLCQEYYALLTFTVIWSVKDNLLSTITPRPLTLLHLCNSMIVLSTVAEYLYLVIISLTLRQGYYITFLYIEF